jgi:hypothetical protein
MTTVASRPLAASGAAADGRRGWAARLDAAIGAVVEAVSAALVVVEIVVLFCGILARYVFHRPLVWSDELASLLFLWLAMLGSVLAFRASEHMRMTALVSKASGSLRRSLSSSSFCIRRSPMCRTRRLSSCRRSISPPAGAPRQCRSASRS